MDRLFQPFMQANTSITRRFGGTGLELAISRQLAEALGGSLTVASESSNRPNFTIAIDARLLEGVPMANERLDPGARAYATFRGTDFAPASRPLG